MIARAWVVWVVSSVLLTASAGAQCVSTAVPVSQPLVFPNHEAGPLAWTGTTFGVAKQDAGSFTNAIDFGVYDANLNQLGSDIVIASSTLAGARATVWNGSEFAVFYQTTGFQIVFQRLDGSGNPIGSPVAVAPQHGVAPGMVYEAAWDPVRKAYAVLHTITAGFARGLWLSLVAPDGTLKSDGIISVFTGDPVYPALAITPAGLYGIAWSRLVNNQQEIAFEVMTPDGLPLNVASVRPGGSFPRVATDGRFFFVVYSAPVSGGGTALRFAKFDLSGNVVTPDSPLVSAPAGQDMAATSAIANATLGEWAVLYQLFPLGFTAPQFAETRLIRVPFSGAVPTDAPFALDPTKRTLAPQSELAWTGFAYVASVGRVVSRTEGTESYLVQQCPLIVTATADPAIGMPFEKITFTANPSGGTAPYKFSWSFGDISSPEGGQTVTHIYQATGTYTVTVTATDATGASRTTTLTVVIANLKRRPAKHI